MVDITGYVPDKGPPVIVPATAFDVELLGHARRGKVGTASFVLTRSVEHLRWYRALIAVIAEARGMHPDQLHADLKFKAGLVRRILMSEGRSYIELGSVAFPKRGRENPGMDEIAFTEYRIIAVNIIFRDYLDPTDKPEVWRRVEELVGPCPW